MDPTEMKEAYHRDAVRVWEAIRHSSYNPNTKGGDFEEALQEFLNTYFDESFTIGTRSAIVDRNLNYNDILTDSENEFDVVATYKGSKPQIMFSVQSTDWVPYDAVAFVCEVKSNMTTRSLEDDLEKLNKLRNLDDHSEDRFSGPINTGTVGHPDMGESYSSAVPRQLHLLVYDTCDVAQETYTDILSEYAEAYDMMLIIENDTAVLNPNTPITVLYGAEPNEGMHIDDYGLIVFLFGISIMTPNSPTINTSETLMNIITSG